VIKLAHVKWWLQWSVTWSWQFRSRWEVVVDSKHYTHYFYSLCLSTKQKFHFVLYQQVGCF